MPPLASIRLCTESPSLQNDMSGQAAQLLAGSQSQEAEHAAACLGALLTLARSDPALLLSLGSNASFLDCLERRLTAPPSQPEEEGQRLACYFLSYLTGVSPAVDASLLRRHFLPALVTVAAQSAAGSWEVKRAALRGIDKLLLAQPAAAREQLLACGLATVSALLLGDGCLRGTCGEILKATLGSHKSLAIPLS